MIARLTVTGAEMHRERRSLPGEAELRLSGTVIEVGPAALLLGCKVILFAADQLPRAPGGDLVAMGEVCALYRIDPLAVVLLSPLYGGLPEIRADLDFFERIAGDVAFRIEHPEGEGPRLASEIDRVVITALIPPSLEARWYARALGYRDAELHVEQGSAGRWSWWASVETHAGPIKAGPCANFNSRQSAEDAAVVWLRGEPK